MIELNAKIKYYQRIAKDKGLGAIPYLAISKCRRVVSASCWRHIGGVVGAVAKGVARCGWRRQRSSKSRSKLLTAAREDGSMGGEL